MNTLRSDEQLIAASREDPRAFRELYDRWAEPLLAYGEIAARLRCSESAARTRVHRGLTHLSDLMEANA
jgi:hypothetical protein